MDLPDSGELSMWLNHHILLQLGIDSVTASGVRRHKRDACATCRRRGFPGGGGRTGVREGREFFHVAAELQTFERTRGLPWTTEFGMPTCRNSGAHGSVSRV